MNMVRGGAAILFMLWLTSICLADQVVLPNASFESGKLSPESWSLSGGTGSWENEGFTGGRSISVTGTGKDGESNYWRCDDYKLEPRQTYRISFAARVSPDASGGTVMTGSNIINRDYSVSTQWEERSFVFTTPDDTSGAFLRFGQWQKSGKVWFDDIEIRPVLPFHHQQGNIQLGEGETIQNGHYKARPSFKGEGANSARILFSHTASFNSNRWNIGNNSEIVYRHQVGNYEQRKASVTVEIGYYRGGKCVVEASSDGHEWQSIGELSGLTSETFPVPGNLLPATEIFVRLSGTEKDGEVPLLQIYGYAYEAELVDESAPDMVGDTNYLDILKSSENLYVELLSPGSLKPGGDNQVNLRLKNMSSSGMSLTAKLSLLKDDKQVDYVRSVELPATAQLHGNGKPKPVDIALDYDIHKAGDFELSISVSDSSGEILHALRTFFHVRPLPTDRRSEIHISAARNEYEPFQLVLRAGQDMENVSIEMNALTNSDGGSISKDNIDMALVGYVYVKIPTDKVGCVGYWPDPLPPYTKPFSLRAGQNQPIWITVYVPTDAPAGDYRSKLTVRSGSWSQQVNVRLHVWDFSLSKETHIRSGLGFSTGTVKQYHRLETDDELRVVVDKYYQTFAAHRISPYDPMSLDPIKVAFISADPVDVKVDFEAFDRSARRYFDELGLSSLRLRLRGMGGGTFHDRYLGEILGYKQGTAEHEAMFTSYLRQIQDHLEANGWLEKAFVYWFDEPDPKDYQFVKDGMDLIHRAAPKITRLLTEQPGPELYGSVDLWCPVTNNYNYERAEERRKAGEHFWWYVCTGPKEPYCTLFIDHYATELRLWLWQTWKYKVDGILVWQSNYWTSRLAFPPPSLQNPYDDPMGYQSGYGRPVGYIGYWGNGDGRFLYPPVEAVGDDGVKSLSGPVNSIRWEMLREGIEDYEYFWMLAEKVKHLKESGKHPELLAEAEKLLDVPESVVESMTEFTIDPQPIYDHRGKIASILEKL